MKRMMNIMTRKHMMSNSKAMARNMVKNKKK